VGIRLPALRERPGDLEPLARHFLARFAPLRPEVRGLDFAPEALERLKAHRWPGNVRELMHAVERAVVLADGPVIGEEDLPEAVRAGATTPPRPAARSDPATTSR
jgi:DNA-binding NtrC family response regulator